MVLIHVEITFLLFVFLVAMVLFIAICCILECVNEARVFRPPWQQHDGRSHRAPTVNTDIPLEKMWTRDDWMHSHDWTPDDWGHSHDRTRDEDAGKLKVS